MLEEIRVGDEEFGLRKARDEVGRGRERSGERAVEAQDVGAARGARPAHARELFVPQREVGAQRAVGGERVGAEDLFHRIREAVAVGVVARALRERAEAREFPVVVESVGVGVHDRHAVNGEARGENVSVGHQAMIHGCTIGDGSLIGINAIVLNGAKIGKNCLVGAGALVTEGKEFPDYSLIIGSPAKAVKTLSPEQIAEMNRISSHYVDNATLYRKTLKKIT